MGKQWVFWIGMAMAVLGVVVFVAAVPIFGDLRVAFGAVGIPITLTGMVVIAIHDRALEKARRKKAEEVARRLLITGDRADEK